MSIRGVETHVTRAVRALQEALACHPYVLNDTQIMADHRGQK